jgi:hypothetical protein
MQGGHWFTAAPPPPLVPVLVFGVAPLEAPPLPVERLVALPPDAQPLEAPPLPVERLVALPPDAQAAAAQAEASGTKTRQAARRLRR